MGTNYYLLRKKAYKVGDATPISLGCCSFPEEVRKLTNGYLLRDTYYATEKELENNFTQEVHIGKSSAGWYFSLCIYPGDINGIDDWKKLFNDPDNKIVDEYGENIDPKEMIRIITKRKWGEGRFTEENMKKALDAHNEMFSGTEKIRSYDEFLAINHAEKGINGLWKHKLDKFHSRAEDKNATYDYIISGNDVENCCIFC